MMLDGPRVLIAEATNMSGQLIAGALRRSRLNFEVRAFSGDCQETLRELRNYKPHVSLISATLGNNAFTGFKVMEHLQAFEPRTAAVMLLDSDERDLVVAAFRAGARGVFCRGGSFKSLPKCIRCVYEGQIWASNAQLEYLLENLLSVKPLRISNSAGMAILTPREKDVARLVAEGLRNHEIAVRLRLREHTVRNYVLQIFDKWGISSRVELVLYAISLTQTNEEAVKGSSEQLALHPF